MRKRKVFSGEAVRAMPQGAGLTQADLAGRIQISPSYLNQIEHNQRPLTAGVLLELARVFRVDPRNFGDDEPNRLLLALRDALADPALGAGEVPASEIKNTVEKLGRGLFLAPFGQFGQTWPTISCWFC